MLEQLRSSGAVRSAGVEEAMATVPRHLFVPGVPLAEAYRSDRAIPTHYGDGGVAVSSASAPGMVAVMLEQLEVRPGQRILEIGAGTGYNAALLAHLAGPAGAVVTVDVDVEVTAGTGPHLAAAGVTGVDVRTADGWLGAADAAPFDRIEVTVGTDDLSPAWVDQLGPRGRLVAPMWLCPGLSASVAFDKVDDSPGGAGARSGRCVAGGGSVPPEGAVAGGASGAPDGAVLVGRSLVPCGFVSLRGPHGAAERDAAVAGWAGRFPGASTEREWLVTMPDADPATLAALRAALEGPVRTVPTPRLPPGWRVGVALRTPGAVALASGLDPLARTVGVLDVEGGGLAVVDGSTIAAFGPGGALERLQAALETLGPLDLSRLRVTAAPHRRAPGEGQGDAVGASSGPIVLRRRSYDLTVWC
jgi:protein-L-isoaspartate(D-aspartate) O-methyltransferase